MDIQYITPDLWQTLETTKLVKAFIKFNISFDKDKMRKDSKNPFLKNGYVSLDNILNTVRPLLSDNGLIISQDLAGDYIVTQLLHESGEFKGSKMHFLPMKVNSGTNALQAMGGGITYAKRYAIAALLGLSIETDDDGNGSKAKKIAPAKKAPAKILPKIETDKKLEELIKWAIDKKWNIKKVEQNYSLTLVQKGLIVSALNAQKIKL